MNRKTKIIVTIGPSSDSEEVLRQLVEGGINVARLNFSFGDHKEHEKNINNIREISSEFDNKVAILQDIQGPKIRIKKIKNKQLWLKHDDCLIITNDELSEDNEVTITYDKLYKDVKSGDRILISDGFIEIEVQDIKNEKIICSVVQGGLLQEGKGLNIPTELKIPTFSDKDINDIIFGLDHYVDYIGISFVRSEEDIMKIKSSIFQEYKEAHPDFNSFPHIIAKIERPEAIRNLDEIILAADGIMIARGDLGIEVPLETIPHIQRKIVQKCRIYSKPVIIATQMLYSMKTATRPTRSEVADIYNAILGGADCLMLSDETAVGENPVLATQMFNRIIIESEKDFSEQDLQIPLQTQRKLASANAVAIAACQLANVTDSKAIVCFTTTGYTALLISKKKPKVDILAITPFEMVNRRLSLYWGVDSKIEPFAEDTDEIINISEKSIIEKDMAQSSDTIIITAGIPLGVGGITNFIKVHKIK